MTERNAILDIDIMVKLTACNIWDEALSLHNVKTAYRLDSAKLRSLITKLEMSNRERKLQNPKLCFTDSEIGTIKNGLALTLESTSLMPRNWLSDAQPLIQKYSNDGIDSGEAEATALLLADNDINLLLSGDKKFFNAYKLNYPNEFSEVTANYSIVSFESCIRKICQLHGFQKIHPKLWQGRFIDKSLMISLGSEGQNSETQFLWSLNQYDPLHPDYRSN